MEGLVMEKDFLLCLRARAMGINRRFVHKLSPLAFIDVLMSMLLCCGCSEHGVLM